MKSDSEEDRHTVKALNGFSLCCSFSALIFYIVVVFAAILIAFITYSNIFINERHHY